jgi:predicted metal-dependent hydrolase
MPKTKLHSTDGRFDDFEPPATTDGSYLGTMKYKKATEAHLQKKFDEELSNVRVRLKAAKTKVSILVNRDSLGLQATLPLRPGDKDINGMGTKQYKIFLGIPANLDGLKTAEEEAYELGKLMARKQFEWTDKYLGKKRLEEKREKTIGELLEKFEEKYFETRKRRLRSENSFRGYMGMINLIRQLF